MKDSILNDQTLLTPAYVYDQSQIERVLARFQALREIPNFNLLYSIKAANLVDLIKLIQSHVDGFSCSSLFEVMLAKEFLSADQTIHITTPGYRPDEIKLISEKTDYFTLNSISQWQLYAADISQDSSCGIRINPQKSFARDIRYDPCRPDSKLGITSLQLQQENTLSTLDWSNIEGLHLHNNCESRDLSELVESIESVINIIQTYSLNLKWLNLGGGYLFDDSVDMMPLNKLVSSLSDKYDFEIFLEPGKAIVGKSARLVASVIDLFKSDSTWIAILDTSINHLPEVFEYQYQPHVANTDKTGNYSYRLSGCSCLSGDIFGDYTFATPLALGDKVVFENMGAYMQVKANMFNGINLPNSYIHNQGSLRLIKQHDYASFRERL